MHDENETTAVGWTDQEGRSNEPAGMESASDAGGSAIHTTSQFDGLVSNYAALMADLSRLGGQWGAERLSDQIWDQLQAIAEKIAVLPAQTYAHLVVKLRISSDLMEGALDPALRALIQSAIADLCWLEAK